MEERGRVQNRREFLRITAGAAAAGTVELFSFRSRAQFTPASVVFAHVSDTWLVAEDKKNLLQRPGWMFAQGWELLEDVLDQMFSLSPPPELIVHSGNFLAPSFSRSDIEKALARLRRWRVPLAFTRGDHDTGWYWKALAAVAAGKPGEGQRYYSFLHKGFLFFHLDTTSYFSSAVSWVKKTVKEQTTALEDELRRHPHTPAILVSHAPLTGDDFSPTTSFSAAALQPLQELLISLPQVILVLSGKVLALRGSFLPDSTILQLTTPAPLVYPCGARRLEVEVDAAGEVIIRSRFVQSRRQELVEDSFHQGSEKRAAARLGGRAERTFVHRRGEKELTLIRTPVEKAELLCPGRERITLAVVADTHLSAEELVTDKERKLYELIGHYLGPGSEELMDDVLEQIAAGRHRIEFFDDVFARQPEDSCFYLALPVDVLLLAGDMTEHGRMPEAEGVRARLDRLPENLRQRTLVATGNHDFYGQEFSPAGSASSRDQFASVYKDYGPRPGRTSYVVGLTEWLFLIVLDMVIPAHDGSGLIQEEVEWVEDQLEALSGRAVILAAHHSVYPLSIEPPLMYAFSRAAYNFTPRVSASRVQLQEMFARFPQVKAVISGHYHGTCVDQHPKKTPGGGRADDRVVTHFQVPCTIEYPCGYRLFHFRREEETVRLEYWTTYTRRHEMRSASAQAPIYRVLGTRARVPRRYEEVMECLARQEHLLGRFAALNPYDLTELNIRGFKDGTAELVRGNSTKSNLQGVLEWTL